MSRLTDLIRETAKANPGLAAELDEEYRELASRPRYGLNFERHRPEAVELPQRPVRRGDKVHVLPPRGTTGKDDSRLWRVVRIERVDGARVAHLRTGEKANVEEAVVPVDDLVVVAEFADPIYPGLVSTGRVERGGDKPFHTVINAENFHALELLTFTHRGRVDAIYIDPPYNTGARDWKYNNDYVEGDDLYRHSKWLAMMERRLKLAQELLNPDDSVLIVTIDEKEYLRLGLLLEQVFPEAQIEMVTSVISSKGVARFGQFSRVEEFIFTVRLGAQEVALGEGNMLDGTRSATAKVGKPVDWLGLRRREPTARRGARPKQFYPVFVDEKTGFIHSVGDEIADEIDRLTVDAPPGTFAVWPLLPDGTEGLWGITPGTARKHLEGGFIRARNYRPGSKRVSIQYLAGGTVSAIQAGEIDAIGQDADGAVIAIHRSAKGVIPKRVWNMSSHNAETGGTNVLSKMLPGRRFPFPKSLYAVEDTLRFFVKDKPQAVILDFFAGSGTTAHAVMRLNRQDGGSRQCISVTNNEVGAEAHRKLRDKGLRPGDPGWEALGICEYVTKPRIRAAITGLTPDGDPVKGSYKFTDEFPMADGFEENAEFFTLTYETPIGVANNHAFEQIAPMLWLRAGASGRRIDTVPEAGWDVADTYGVLFDLDEAAGFVSAVEANDGVTLVFVVTDDDSRFQRVCQQLPSTVRPIRLYESYLSNFRILNGGRA